jgi:predicted DNA-binding protein with PD1-like motif
MEKVHKSKKGMHTKKATVTQFVEILVRELVGRVRFISIS